MTDRGPQHANQRPAGTTRAAPGVGWRTTDADEVERRRRRAATEELSVRPTDPGGVIYGGYLVESAEGRSYRVELRSLDEAINACDCPDYEVNGLGTCKHIEAVLHQLGNPELPLRRCTEVYLDRRSQYQEGPRIRILWADGLGARSRVRRTLEPYFSSHGELLGDPLEGIPALARALQDARLGPRQVRISEQITVWVERLRREQARREARERLLADVAAGKRDLDVVRHPLYDYQREGMLHLAFGERAILADEMGLGKTVQAVAASELLRRLHGIERVLVVSPASLKTEWEEQIAKFTGLSAQLVQGRRPERLRQYRRPAFFNLANYEQIRSDQDSLQRLLAPDLIILDEAQRIKNWQSKTAQAVKRLRSPYLFVLTGTPLENRIDEIYSIAQAIDPHLLGPLFRFNREFYELDERGRPQGYKNLDELHRRLRPVLLRRRKSDVEGELPERTVNTYFVSMHPEQQVRYEEYSASVARLMQIARKRPLSPEEFKRLQQQLACMRMVCDTPYILDPECRVSPKLDELVTVLGELLEDPANKILVFSEWTRMLELVREYAEASGTGYALHTGQVPQARRREEINRFKQDPACRLFLSSDAGATGLNLQAANVVINLDLPWNPAKLEQRIARAWRKHQSRAVSVINLVCEDSIEHRILHLLERKQALADGVLDGGGESAMALPSSGQALMERVADLMGLPPDAGPAAAGPAVPAPAPAEPLTLEDLPQELEARHPQGLERLDLFQRGDGPPAVLAVVHGDMTGRREEMQGVLERCPEPATAEVIDTDTLAVIQRLVDAGILSVNDHRALHRSPAVQQREADRLRQRLAEARRRLAEAERRLRMARLLLEGGFPEEALAPLREAVEQGLAGLGHALGMTDEPPIPLARVRQVLAPEIGLSAGDLATLAALREGSDPSQQNGVALAEELLASIGQRLDREAL